jgi:hypothetical protein
MDGPLPFPDSLALVMLYALSIAFVCSLFIQRGGG